MRHERAGFVPSALRALHSARCPPAQCSPPCSARQYATARHAEHTLNSRTVYLQLHQVKPRGGRQTKLRSSSVSKRETTYAVR